DARQLLGEIETTRARLLIEAAAAARARVEDNRTSALDKVAAARDQGITADYHRALGQAPRGQLLKLQQDIQARCDKALAAVKTLDGRIATLTARITQLANENTKLAGNSRKLRAESDLAAGRERLDKVHQAQDLERKANANTAQADAARDETANLEVDRSLQADAARDADAELAELAKRLAAMDEEKKRQDAHTLGASDEAERTAQSAHTAAEEVLQRNAEALALEQEALAALDQATKDFAEAAGDVRTVIQAARSARGGASSGSNSELLEDLADDKHLAMILGSKASTHLMMGDLRSEEVSAAAEMAALAKTIADLAGKLGVAEPVVVGKLRDAGKPADKTGADAVADYSQAEKDFNTVLSSTLVDKIGRDIKWMYEGRLANAYLGHYRLTGDGKILGEARAAVAKATEGKNESPYLASVFRLKALIDAVPSN
ncbi:MAG TPA: hypothetical protein VM389_02950, partial [Phycisphaerae bacterium]|nr:hypothetical protein [Phycisphaerae bacterium]